jgi:hypothetical protein
MTAKVVLDLKDAETIARAVRYAETVPGLAQAFAHLVDAIDVAPLGAELDEILDFGPPARRVGDARPRWDHLRSAVRRIRRFVEEDPGNGALADALGAYVRDTFDEQGLSLHDETTVFVAVTTASLMVEMAKNGQSVGLIGSSTVREVASIAQSFTAGVLPYLPPEAK